VEGSIRDAVDAGGRLTPPSQSRQDVLGATVLAFRKPLAQLTEDQARHTVVLESSEQLLLSAASAVSNRHLNSFERAIAWAHAADPESRRSLEGRKLQRCLEVAPGLGPVIG
jgi:hypothetical protein